MTVLVCPLVIMPVIAQVPIGVLTDMGVPPVLQLFFNLAVFITLCVSLIAIMENRYFLLFAKNTAWKSVRKPFILINYILIVSFLIPIAMHIPDQQWAVETVRNMHPEIPSFLFSKPLCIVSIDYFYISISVLLAGSAIILESYAFGVLLYKNIRKHSRKQSLKTFHMQKKFLLAIAVQSLIPLILMTGPAAYFVYSISTDYYNQMLNNVSLIVISSHGWVSTIIMVLIHEPYRNFCFGKLRMTRMDLRGKTVETRF